MASVRFYLKDPKSKNSTPIYLVCHLNYFTQIGGTKKFHVVKLYTGEKIKPEFWNSKTNKAKTTDKNPGHSDLNSLLSSIASIIENEHTRILNEGKQVTPEYLKERIKKRLGIKTEPQEGKIDLMKFIEQFIEVSKSGSRTTENGKKINLGTIKQYQNTLNHLIEFQKTYRRKIDFDTIDLDFYDDLLKYFNSQNYATNSIGKTIKNIKLFMRAAAEKKLHVNHDYQNKRFRKITEIADTIYLNDEELLRIYNLDLSANPAREKTRDLFLIGCYTGLRFSDYNKLRPENIKKTERGTFLNIKTQKTNELVIIPLNWMILEILEKYNQNLPGAFTNQEMNRELKEIGKAAEIAEKVSITATRGGLRTDTIHQKYELISTHTARRSFATNSYLAGIPTISIMKITGHRTDKAFMLYIKISQEDNANKLAEHPYFSQHKPGDLKLVK